MIWHRQPSLARLTLALNVADSFGIPLEVRYGGLRLDLDRDAMTAVGTTANGGNAGANAGTTTASRFVTRV